MLPTVLTLAFVIPIPFFRPVLEHTNQGAWNELVAAFSQRGVAVSGDHPRCRERDLYGLYVRGSKRVVVCDRGDRSNTLRHEGWHLVQSLCLRDRQWLEPAVVERRLSREERLELRQLSQPERWHREAEARVIARLSVNDYLQEMSKACAHTASMQPAER
ncbi:MAG: hypothetical protein ACKOHJ_03265 [Vulcanococcus sp.]